MCEAFTSRIAKAAGAGQKGQGTVARPDPASVPLGDGLANNARLSISGRQRQIDEVVESANTGIQIPRRKN